MSWWQALILGVVQGLTEFFPISSSGHLQLVPWLFDWNDLESQSVSTAFDAALHLGTLLAVVVAVRHDLVSLIVSGVRYPFASVATRATLTHGRLAWLYVLTAVPAAAVGVFFDGFDGEVVTVAFPGGRHNDDAVYAGTIHILEQLFMAKRDVALRMRACRPGALRRVGTPDVYL